MALIKCKMCGGDLVIAPGSTVAECEFCGTKQTVPSQDNEKKLTLFSRANRLRMNCEFDKAYNIYESIVAEFPDEAEAYWGLVLCKYGIEYVDDPASGKKIPTCHRSSFESVIEDTDLEQAIENADLMARRVYREEAKAIEEIRKDILRVSGTEKPYDIFICYKETNDSGDRTIDSVIAQDVYDALTDKGYRVFFSRITLEDKLGQEYEPYIFAALNSAKIMLVFGTDYEYYNAVWVKNEWSRYLKLMAKDKTKHLIPCYKNIDVYDMPKEFAKLQAQDMGKVGALQDLLRGIEKLLHRGSSPTVAQVHANKVQTSGGPQAEALLKRGYMALEDSEWAKADQFFEDVLNQNAECAEAYIGKLFALKRVTNYEGYTQGLYRKYTNDIHKSIIAFPENKEHIDQMTAKSIPGYFTKTYIRDLYSFDRTYDSVLESRKKQLSAFQMHIDDERLLSRAKQYAVGQTKKSIEDTLKKVSDYLERKIEDAQKADDASISRLKAAYTEHTLAIDNKIEKLIGEANEKREIIYQRCIEDINRASSITELEEQVSRLKGIGDYKDSDKQIQFCQARIQTEKQQQQEKERLLQCEEAYKQCVNDIRNAKDIYSLDKIIHALNKLGTYKDSLQLIYQCQQEIQRLKEKDTQEQQRARDRQKRKARIKTISIILVVVILVGLVVFYMMYQQKMKQQNYEHATVLMESGMYSEAISVFDTVQNYKDSSMLIEACQYNIALSMLENGMYDEALGYFRASNGYGDSEIQIQNATYKKAQSLMNNGEYDGAFAVFSTIRGYQDVDILLETDDNLIIAARAAAHEKNIAPFKRVGKYVSFGHYEQDNDTSNGQENIEWLILDVQGNKALLVSRYGLDVQQYDRTFGDSAWEKCELRSWLNDSFLKEAFSVEEQTAVLTTNVDNSRVQGYSGWSVSGGANTKDKVFLLSYKEANQYFSSQETLKLVPTNYAKETLYAMSDFTYKVDGKPTTIWWLRSPGSQEGYAMVARFDGSFTDLPVGSISAMYTCVRPTIWIDLDSSFF